MHSDTKLHETFHLLGTMSYYNHLYHRAENEKRYVRERCGASYEARVILEDFVDSAPGRMLRYQ